MNYKIKISGSGTKEEILKALKNLQETLGDSCYNGGFVSVETFGKFTTNDGILVSETELKEE